MSDTDARAPEGRRSNKKRRDRTRLPKKLIIIKNADKEYHEKWKPGRDLLNIPHPFRALCMGKPNSGKTLVIKNMLIRASPPFERVVVVHCDPEHTSEYDDIGAEMLGDIPPPEDWDGEHKTLCILDDLEYRRMPKDQARCLDRLVGYVSTHRNVSVIITGQDPFALPVIARRCANLLILWRSHDWSMMSQIARKTGMTASDFKEIFKNHMPERHDSLWVDLTRNTPAPLRKNGYDIITRAEHHI